MNTEEQLDSILHFYREIYNKLGTENEVLNIRDRLVEFRAANGLNQGNKYPQLIKFLVQDGYADDKDLSGMILTVKGVMFKGYIKTRNDIWWAKFRDRIGTVLLTIGTFGLFVIEFLKFLHHLHPCICK